MSECFCIGFIDFMSIGKKSDRFYKYILATRFPKGWQNDCKWFFEIAYKKNQRYFSSIRWPSKTQTQ